jgi:radical SAM protein with 4Fe4S-binding SPASM domain
MVEMDPKGMTGVGLSKGHKVCPSPFYSLSIHSNGEVGVCCSDWSHKTIVGSIETERIGDIWKGEQLQKFREDQLNKSWRGMAACAGCEMVHHYPKYEDLDNFIDQIKQKGI